MTSATEIAGQRAELERQDPEEVGHERTERIRDGQQDPERHDRPEEADERALEDERPADERVRRSDQAHDLDLVGAGEDREPDRVDDDEQGDDTDDQQDDGPGRAQDAGHGQDAIDQVFDVDHPLDARIVAESVGDDADLRGIDHLDLEARVQRVRVEVLGQVLLALGLERCPKASQGLVTADVVDRGDLGHAP